MRLPPYKSALLILKAVHLSMAFCSASRISFMLTDSPLVQGRSCPQRYSWEMKQVASPNCEMQERSCWAKRSPRNLLILSLGRRAIHITWIILLADQPLVLLPLLQLASVHWRSARRRLALSFAPQPFVASLASNRAMVVLLVMA